jgi:hypothetical protein
MPYFTYQTLSFYTRHITCRFVVKQLCGHIAYEDVRENFWFQLFNILKYIKYVFQNKESIYSQEPKHHEKHPY